MPSVTRADGGTVATNNVRKPAISLWTSIDEQASEAVLRSHWGIRPIALSLPHEHKHALKAQLEKDCARDLADFHAAMRNERIKHRGKHLSDDEILASSPEACEKYARRRTAEALLAVLCRETEQRPPKTLPGAMPC
jgi:hypothetical protein